MKNEAYYNIYVLCYLQNGNWMILDLKSPLTGLSIFSLFIWLSLQFYVSVKNCEESEISPTSKLTSLPATVSWELAEDRRLLGQRQMTLLFVAIAADRLSALTLVHWIPAPAGQVKRATRWHLYTKWFAFPEQNSDLREFECS